VGNKTDLEALRVVTFDTAFQEALKNGALCVETCAKTNENVDFAFKQLVKDTTIKKKIYDDNINPIICNSKRNQKSP